MKLTKKQREMLQKIIRHGGGMDAEPNRTLDKLEEMGCIIGVQRTYSVRHYSITPAGARQVQE